MGRRPLRLREPPSASGPSSLSGDSEAVLDIIGEPATPEAAKVERALVQLLRQLGASGYRFVTPTPSTHELVAGRRPRARPGNLRDIFGWGRSFGADDLEPALLAALDEGGALRRDDAGLRAAVRVSTLGERLFLHSAAGADPNAVFLGPDSYRFVRLLHATGLRMPAGGRILDIGVGAGAGAVTLAAAFPQAEVWGSDVNPAALRFARVNAMAAGLTLQTAEGAGPEAAPGEFDLIAANPPYIAGRGGRVYRDGGDALGTEVALDWARTAVRRLRPGGALVLYTGSPIVDDVDPVQEALSELARAEGLELVYEEIDPDVFGGTLKREAYRDVERIAAVGARLTARANGGG